MNFRNKKGQSLVQSIVALGLMAVVGTIIAVIVANVQSMVADTTKVLKIEELHSEIMLLLSDTIQCTNTFSPFTIPPSGGSVAISDIRIKDNSVKFSSSTAIASRDLRIESMTAKEFDSAATSGVTAPYTGKFTFEIKYSYRLTPGGTAREQTRHIKIKSLPTNWSAGSAIVDNTRLPGCSSGLGATTGLDLEPFVTRENNNNIKYNTLRVNGAVDVIVNPLTGLGGNIIGQNGGSLVMLSDERLKAEAKLLAINYEEIRKVEGYSFNWKDSKKPDYGFMSNEIEALDANLILHRLNHPDAVKYQGLVPILHQSVINLNGELESLRNRIKKLRKK